jgi:hypothetical protein
LDQRQIGPRRLHRCYVWPHRILPGIQRIDRLGFQADELPRAGQHRHSGKIEVALEKIIGGTLAALHREIRSGDRIAVRLPIVGARNGGNGVPVLSLSGIRELLPPAPNDVHPLHLLAAAKKKPSRKLARIQQSVRLARRRLPLTDVVKLRQCRKIVRAQRERLRHALVGIGTADDIDRMHHRPVHRLVEGCLRAPGKDVVVGL